ncbi:methyltransferase type 11 [Luminiphilus sp. nBUS_16]|uniref:hypothetical protein n=1 Tax=Luminiphilus sp. nBUS_16 TaxID=3395315 RepID=UPI003EBEC4CF
MLIKDLVKDLLGKRVLTSPSESPADDMDVTSTLLALDEARESVKNLDREDVAYPAVFGSECCRFDHFQMPLFKHWIDRLGYGHAYHRKLWEFVFILQSLKDHGMLSQGCRGLGFAVGTERIPDLLASCGVSVLATDLHQDEGIAKGWADSSQLAVSQADLFSGISEKEQFDQMVDFANVDMNSIPANLQDFDFCWSSCAFEHLGSIEAGKAFVKNSLDTLRSGGLAVHTTELNLSSDEDTVTSGGTVLFRRRDFREIASALRKEGHTVAPLNFYQGNHPLDQYIDMPPYSNDVHLRLSLMEYSTTSFGLVILKR